MAKKALRCICIGYKEINSKTDIVTKDQDNIYEVEKFGLTVLAILGIKDTLR